jgi:3-hydroxyisobutyrate dehydrogenase-like beta-hydroxyacid dehydrogenase
MIEKLATGTADPSFGQKDLGLALEMAHDHGIAMPVTGLVAQLLAKVYGVYDDDLR